jgi:hypothetical protein
VENRVKNTFLKKRLSHPSQLNLTPFERVFETESFVLRKDTTSFNKKIKLNLKELR